MFQKVQTGKPIFCTVNLHSYCQYYTVPCTFGGKILTGQLHVHVLAFLNSKYIFVSFSFDPRYSIYSSLVLALCCFFKALNFHGFNLFVSPCHLSTGVPHWGKMFTSHSLCKVCSSCPLQCRHQSRHSCSILTCGFPSH